MTALAAVVASKPARAQSSSEPPLLELGAGAFARYDQGDFCDVDGDLVSCTSGKTFVGGELVPRLRALPMFSFGVIGAYGVAFGSEGTASSDGSHSERTVTTYRIGAEARVYPGHAKGSRFWLAFELGVTWLRDTSDFYDSGDEYLRSATATDVGRVAAFGIGMDFEVLPLLALGPEFRTGVVGYPDATSSHGAASDTPYIFYALGITGTVLVGP